MGLTSLLAMEFRNRLERALGRALPATLAWNYPTVRALADHLADDTGTPVDRRATVTQYSSDPTPHPAWRRCRTLGRRCAYRVARTPTEQRLMSALATFADLSAVKLALMAQEMRAQTSQVLRADPIAIVGMACRTPGGCETPDAFWHLLAAGVDATRDIPADRFDTAPWRDPDPAAAGKMQATRGGFLTRRLVRCGLFRHSPARSRTDGSPAAHRPRSRRSKRSTMLGFLTLRGGSRRGVHGLLPQRLCAPCLSRPNAFDTRTLTGSVHCVVANRSPISSTGEGRA